MAKKNKVQVASPTKKVPEDEEVVVTKKTKSKKPAATPSKKKAPPPKPETSSSEEDSSEEEVAPPPVKSKAKVVAKKVPAPPADSSSSEDSSEEEAAPPPKVNGKAKISKAKAPAAEETDSSEDDSDDETEMAVTPAEINRKHSSMAPKAAAAEDSEEDSDDEEEEETTAKPEKRKSEAVTHSAKKTKTSDSSDEEESDSSDEEAEEAMETDEKPVVAKPVQLLLTAKLTKLFSKNIRALIEAIGVQCKKCNSQQGNNILIELPDQESADKVIAEYNGREALASHEWSIEAFNPEIHSKAALQKQAFSQNQSFSAPRPSQQGGDRDARTLFVKGLQAESGQDDLATVFPTAEEIRVPSSRDNPGQHRGIAYIQFGSVDEVNTWMKTGSASLQGSLLTLDYIGDKARGGRKGGFGDGGGGGGGGGGDEEATSLKVFGLTHSTTDDMLYEAFPNCTGLKLFNQMQDKPGMAFIDYRDHSATKAALDNSYGLKIDNTEVEVKLKTPFRKSFGGGGFGGRGGGGGGFRGGGDRGFRGRGGGRGGFGRGRGGFSKPNQGVREYSGTKVKFGDD